MHKMFTMPWWRNQMEALSAVLALCAGNSPVIGEFPAQRPVTRSLNVFLDLRLNKRLSKQSRGWWFKTPSHTLKRHFNVYERDRQMWRSQRKKLFNDIKVCVKFHFFLPNLVAFSCYTVNIHLEKWLFYLFTVPTWNKVFLLFLPLL